jgi:hypothetical protein
LRLIPLLLIRAKPVSISLKLYGVLFLGAHGLAGKRTNVPPCDKRQGGTLLTSMDD